VAAAHSAQLLGAAVVIVAARFRTDTEILGEPEVDCGVDAVGFEARGHGEHADEEMPATVLNSLMDLTRAGGALGIPGLFDRCQIAKAVNATVISLDEAPEGYENFDQGAARKYVLNPHGLIPQA
jgi:glutathione-independent formaldehyde dehydrogenase